MVREIFGPGGSVLVDPISSVASPSCYMRHGFSPSSLSSTMLVKARSSASSQRVVAPRTYAPMFHAFPSGVLTWHGISHGGKSSRTSTYYGSMVRSVTLTGFVLHNLPFSSSNGLSKVGLRDLFRASGNGFYAQTASLVTDFITVMPWIVV